MIRKLLLAMLIVSGSTIMMAQPNLSFTLNNPCFGGGGNLAFLKANSNVTSTTWTINGPSCTATVLSTTKDSALVQLGCCGIHMVACTGYSNSVALWTATMSMNVPCTPTVSINNNTGTGICAGSTAILQASSGSATGYTWTNNGANSPSIVVSPSVNTCYSVTVKDAQGCTAMASSCIIVKPWPNVSIAGGGTVCLGSSVTMSVTGIGTSTWNPGSVNTWTYNVIPTAQTMYTVTGDLNGCAGIGTVIVTPLSSCANVWPGDANSDGTVDASDVLELGLYANNTGAPRSSASINYVAQYAAAWTGSGSNSQNQSHVDCNGDGTVNANDTVAITTNWALNHSFKNSASSAAGDITLVAPTVVPNNGTWVKLDIMAGSSTNVLTDIYGIAFDVLAPTGPVDPDYYIKYTPSFLNANNQNIFLRHKTAGVIHAATVRTDKGNVTGQGKIGELYFKAKAGSSGAITFAINGLEKIDKAGTSASVAGSSVTMQLTKVGLNEIQMLNAINVYPNPASDMIMLSSPVKGEFTYQLTDISGRVILNGTFSNETSVDLSTVKTGIYFIQLNSNDQKVIKKIVVE